MMLKMDREAYQEVKGEVLKLAQSFGFLVGAKKSNKKEGNVIST